METGMITIITIIGTLTFMALGILYFVVFLNSLAGYTPKWKRKRNQKEYDKWFQACMDRMHEK
jgi:hypothetical protein